MAKLLFFLLIGLLAYLLLKPRRPSGPAAPPSGRQPETMVSCAHCGLNVPLSDSLVAGDRRYCCEEHRALGANGRR